MKVWVLGLSPFAPLPRRSRRKARFGPAWVEGHNYKVVDGQLVDLGPAPIPTLTLAPTATPSPTPTQPTIIINNNTMVQAPASQATPVAPPIVYVPVPATPTPAHAGVPSDFVISVLRAYNNHDYLALSPYLVPGHVNYFGHRYASPSFIRNDMVHDARAYAMVLTVI